MEHQRTEKHSRSDLSQQLAWSVQVLKNSKFRRSQEIGRI